MVLRVRPTPTRFPTNSLYTPVDNTPLHSISSVCHPLGEAAAVSLLRGGDACQLPTLLLIFEFALDSWYLPQGLANRLAYHIRGADTLEILGRAPFHEDQRSCLIRGFSAMSRGGQQIM